MLSLDDLGLKYWQSEISSILAVSLWKSHGSHITQYMYYMLPCCSNRNQNICSVQKNKNDWKKLAKTKTETNIKTEITLLVRLKQDKTAKFEVSQSILSLNSKHESVSYWKCFYKLCSKRLHWHALSANVTTNQ